MRLAAWPEALLPDGGAGDPRHLDPVAEATDADNLLSLADGNHPETIVFALLDNAHPLGGPSVRHSCCWNPL